MIAIISHDAGGAEILSSWALKCTEPFTTVLEGPAKTIFQRKLGDYPKSTLSESIAQCNWVLCGTSWQSNLERLAIIQAKVVGKKVVVFLDHWVCYEERFQEHGVSVYPDEIWVGDLEAEKMAQRHFPKQNIILKANPYVEDLKIELGKLQFLTNDCSKCSVLYICEPLSEQALQQYGDEYYWGYTEKEALQFFLKNINVLDCVVSRIKIRPHPSENKYKYDWAKQSSSLHIEIGGNKTLLEETVEADIVVGCESMAMVVGLLAKKRVISSIPPGGKPCSLPHSEIEQLQALLIDNSSLNHA